MRQRLIAGKLFSIAEKMEIEQPNLCSKTSGGYGLYSVQHQRLSAAAEYHRESALGPWAGDGLSLEIAWL